MRRTLLTLSLAGLFGAFLTVGEAQACHKKKCTPACAPAPVVVACAPAPAACVPAKKCGSGFKMPKIKMGGLCHKKAAATCAPATYAAAPTYYAAPVYAAPQASAQAHATGQGM